MVRRISICLLLLSGLVCMVPHTYAGGLSTTFGEVELENLRIGEEHSMEKAAEFPLIVKNTADEEIELKVEVLYPKEGELKEGFEPIPDISWIAVEKDHFILAPDEEARTDVTIKVPEDKKYSGGRYQVYIWSHTIGRSLGVGLKSRLLFTIKAREDENETTQ